MQEVVLPSGTASDPDTSPLTSSSLTTSAAALTLYPLNTLCISAAAVCRSVRLSLVSLPLTNA